MNEERLFLHHAYDDTPLSKQYEILGVACAHMAKALDEKDEEIANGIMEDASKVFHPLDCKAFNSIYFAIRQSIALSFYENEYTYHKLFKDNASKIIKDCEVINIKTDGHNIPDAWVKIKGYICPVEIKYGPIDGKAKKQIMRYMKAYKSDMGITVGQELIVDLPENIKFIPLLILDEYKEK